MSNYNTNNKIAHEAPVAVTLGYFDGVHLGHAGVIEKAAKQKLFTLVVTFAQNPGKTVNGAPVQEITCRELKEKAIADLGADGILYLDFQKVRNLEPESFIEMLASRINLKFISVGFNYRFGKNAKAGIKELKKLCEPRGIAVCAVEPVCRNGVVISSSLIRGYIEDGDVKTAAEYLGRPFSVYSKVIHGRMLGRRLGIPTINQLLPPQQILPRFGVYASVVCLDGKKMPAVTNIGVKPTVLSKSAPLAETFIFGFHGDLYGKFVQIDLIEFVRPEKRFDSIEQLQIQMKRDAEQSKKLLQSYV